MTNPRTEEDIREEMAPLISELMNVRHPDANPFVTGWILLAAVEATGWPDRERCEATCPRDQSVIFSIGLITDAGRWYGQPDEEE